MVPDKCPLTKEDVDFDYCNSFNQDRGCRFLKDFGCSYKIIEVKR